MQYSLIFSSPVALSGFWFRIASSATAVLPVCRSPMISSRWPRPIGISASIAFSPVCTGSCTDLRGVMPGGFPSPRPPAPHRHVDDRAGPRDGVAFADLLVVAEDHHADIVGFQVQRHAAQA